MFLFTVIEALSITGIAPSAGSVGSSVTISGAGFGSSQSDSVVTFDGVAATVSSWSDTQIVAIVPAGAATGPVTVEVAANTADGPIYEISTSVTLTDSLGHQSTYASEMVGGKVVRQQFAGVWLLQLHGSWKYSVQLRQLRQRHSED